MSKIVILDGFTANPGDLSWSELEALGSVEVYDRTAPDLVISRAQDAEVVLTNKTVLSAETLTKLPRLRYIGVLATGYNVVDLNAASQRNIVVTNIPGYSTSAVAQATFALLFALTNHVADLSEQVHQGRWSSSPDFCFWDAPLVEVSGLTMGIIGFGAIGKAVAVRAHAFGMRVQVFTRSPQQDDRVEFISNCDAIFESADVVSLHCPLTPQTERMVNANRLARMKPTSYLLNTARGPLIDEGALAAALNAGQIAGAGLDVLSTEPPSTNNPLLTAKNCLITPHVAWAARAARSRLIHEAAENVRAFCNGQARNRIN